MSILQIDDAYCLAYAKMDELCIFYKADIVKVKPIDQEDMVMFSVMKNNIPIAELIWDRKQSAILNKPAFYDWSVQKHNKYGNKE